MLESREIRGGVGVSYVDSHGPITESSFRLGAGNNIDFGIKVGFNALRRSARGLVPYIDARYQFLKEPIAITSGIGATWFFLDRHPPNGQDVEIWTIQPFLLAGQENWYVGVRPYYSFDGSGTAAEISPALFFQDRSWSAVSLTLGGSIRLWNDARILLEINHIIFSGGKSVNVPAFGIQKGL